MEEQAHTSKRLHSGALSEHHLASAAAVASTSKVPPLLQTPSESAIKSNYEVVCESDRNFDGSFSEDTWTFYPNVSDEVRWNQRPTHTYDSCFMLPDSYCDTVVRSEGKLKVIMDNEFNSPYNTSLAVETLTNEMKSLNSVQENVLHESESGSAKSVKSGKKSRTTKKKKVIAKKATAGANAENLSQVASQKAVPPASKKKKVLKSKQKWSELEMLSVLEVDTKVQQTTQDSAAKPSLSSKAKKGGKKLKKAKKDEEMHFKEVRRQGREASFNQSVAAYISVCVSGLALMFDEKNVAAVS